MRWNCPPIAAASDLTESVFARPGTPSTSRWPPQSRAIAIRSSSRSWPTMVRFTSNSTGCRGLAWWSGDGSWPSAGTEVIGLLRLVVQPSQPYVAGSPGPRSRAGSSSLGSCSRGSYLRPRPRPVACGAAERGADGHREPDAGEGVLAVGMGEPHHDADALAAAVEQRAAGAAGVDGRVELDQPAALAGVGVRVPVKPGDHAGGHAVRQAERVADRDDGRPDAGGSAEGRGNDDRRQSR